MGFFTIISQNNNSKKGNSVPLSIQTPYGSLNKKKHIFIIKRVKVSLNRPRHFETKLIKIRFLLKELWFLQEMVKSQKNRFLV